MRNTLTRKEAEVFLELPEKTRINFLKTLSVDERCSLAISLALAIDESIEEPEKLAA